MQATIMHRPWNATVKYTPQTYQWADMSNQIRISELNLFPLLTPAACTWLACNPVHSELLKIQDGLIENKMSKGPTLWPEILPSELQGLYYLATATAARQCLWQGDGWPECELGLGKEILNHKASRREAPKGPTAEAVCLPDSLREMEQFCCR